MGQSIKIKIAGNEYPLVAATPEMEQLMRLAAEAINQKLTAYDAKFPNKSLSDKLSFVALRDSDPADVPEKDSGCRRRSPQASGRCRVILKEY